MCHVYASTAPQRFENVTRSVRVQGCVTSVRLENEFWEILDTLAGQEGMSTARFIGKLYDEVIAERGEVANLASMLRVVCAVYLKLPRQPNKSVALPRTACL